MSNNVAGEVLLAYIERIERLEQEKADISADIREVYAEAKGNGYDPKIIRKVVVNRRRTTYELQEENSLVELYQTAIERAPADN